MDSIQDTHIISCTSLSADTHSNIVYSNLRAAKSHIAFAAQKAHYPSIGWQLVIRHLATEPDPVVDTGPQMHNWTLWWQLTIQIYLEYRKHSIPKQFVYIYLIKTKKTHFSAGTQLVLWLFEQRIEYEVW